VKQITDDFIKSNNIYAGKYISEKHLDFYFQTKTLCVVSTCIDYLNGLLLLPYRKNMRKMAIYCCKCSNNQSLRACLKIEFESAIGVGLTYLN